jgi:hypothetical protein
MRFQFSNYSVEELRRCGEEFARDFTDVVFHRTNDWTSAVSDWFCKSMAAGLVCYKKGQVKEFLTLDQCHVTFRIPVPTQDATGCKRWDQPLIGPCELRLAMTHETGKDTSFGETCARLLDDAWKVALIRATAKVFVFPTHQGARCGKTDRQEMHRRKIVGSLGTLRTQSHDDAPWLWIDLPWLTSEDDLPRDTTTFAVLDAPQRPV